MKKIKIIGIGIATMDIYCHMNRMYPGGNEYNIAYNAKLQGADSGFMGVFADDRVGQILEETLKLGSILVIPITNMVPAAMPWLI